jgi:5-formyltetrahydrofolate cyclo-ligase
MAKCSNGRVVGLSTMKDALRLRFRALRDAIGAEERAQSSLRIATWVAQLPRYREARSILLYAAFGSEVETRPLRERALKEGKIVLLPRIEDRQLKIHDWRAGDQLVQNRHGIPEPLASAPEADPRALEFIVIPGLAFDVRGGRLGYGGGYYDKLLGTISHAYRVGVCFARQVVQELPSTHLDAPMDCVVTENGVNKLPRRHH